MSNVYEMEVTLPSRDSDIYKNNPELRGVIKLRMMTVEDEKKIFSSVSEESINNLLNSCVISPEFDSSILLPQDRHFLLVKLRILSYGADYHTIGRCPYCGEEEEHKINIDDVEVFNLPTSFKEPIEVDLPFSKDKVGLKLLRNSDLNAIKEKSKRIAKTKSISQVEFEFVERLVRRLVTINGEKVNMVEAEDFVKNMKAVDRAFIDYTLNKVKVGYSNVVKVCCSNCGETYEAPFGINSEFFRPRFD